MNVLVISEEQFNELNSKMDNILARLNSESPQKEWLSNKEALKLLSVGQTTLWTYRKQGKIKAKKIQRKLYFNRQDVLMMIEKGII